LQGLLVINLVAVKNTQVQIRLNDALEDRAVVERILLETSKKFQLFDNTATSKVQDTIKSLVEREHHGFGLGARIVNGLIVIDFFPHRNPPPMFNDVRQFVMDNLFLAFPNNAQEIGADKFIGLHE
jgi:hypothetical protein